MNNPESKGPYLARVSFIMECSGNFLSIKTPFEKKKWLKSSLCQTSYYDIVNLVSVVMENHQFQIEYNVRGLSMYEAEHQTKRMVESVKKNGVKSYLVPNSFLYVLYEETRYLAQITFTIECVCENDEDKWYHNYMVHSTLLDEEKNDVYKKEITPIHDISSKQKMFLVQFLVKNLTRELAEKEIHYMIADMNNWEVEIRLVPDSFCYTLIIHEPVVATE